MDAAEVSVDPSTYRFRPREEVDRLDLALDSVSCTKLGAGVSCLDPAVFGSTVGGV